MPKTNLTFVPLMDMIDEIERRHSSYALVVCRRQSGNVPVVDTYWKSKTWLANLGIVSILANDIYFSVHKES